jgi:hypothetical protein
MELDERERVRLDIEVLTTSALRDGMSHATGKPEAATYKQAEALGIQTAPELYQSVNRILGRPKESTLAQEIRQTARAQSRLENRVIPALEYLQGEIGRLKNQIEAASDSEDDAHLLENKLDKLQAVYQEIKPQEKREVSLILGDAIKSGLDLPSVFEGDDYKDYRLNEERILRVRVAHLMALEDKVGCDLIYENLNYKKKTARLVIIQYKTWENNSLHYNPREAAQYERLEGFACKCHLCDGDSVTYRTYRLPNCAAFVRPTDRLQDPASQIVSSSLHIPVCVIKGSWVPNQNGGKSLRRGHIEYRSLSHKTFGELFGNAMVGSKEISWDTMTDLYKAYGILTADERVVVHMQTVSDFEEETAKPKSSSGKRKGNQGSG